MGKMKIYTQEEMLDKSLGPKGCPARDDYEAKTEDYLLGKYNTMKKEPVTY